MPANLSIGDVAEKSGLSRDTIRYYERLGLLPRPTRSDGGYRQYGESIVNRLAVIRNAQEFGFSLRDICAFLRTRERGGKPCDEVRRAAEVMLKAVDQQITDLIATRNRMQQTLRSWDRKLAGTAADQPAYLLETLRGSDLARTDRRAPPKRR